MHMYSKIMIPKSIKILFMEMSKYAHLLYYYSLNMQFNMGIKVPQLSNSILLFT